MDTFQWLDAAFAQYKHNHSISRTKTYSTLCEESNDLIDFLTPMGFNFRLDSTYSSVLSKSVSLRLPGNTFRLGFIHQSPQQQQSSSTLSAAFFGPYFMYGQLSSSSPTALEAYYSQRLRSQGHVSFSSSLLTGHCRSNLSWSFRGGKTSSTWSYCSFGRILGWQALNHFRGPKGSAWCGSWGGEVYYTAQENSGGISFGLRLEDFGRESKGAEESTALQDTVKGSNKEDSGNSTPNQPDSSNPGQHDSSNPSQTDSSNPSQPDSSNPSQIVSTGPSQIVSSNPINTNTQKYCKAVVTLTGNPLMGHYRTTLTAPIICPGLRASCRYDINLNSFDSDLSAGLAYDLPADAGAIKVAAGMRSGISFVLQTWLAEGLKVRFGLKTGLNDATFGFDFVIKN